LPRKLLFGCIESRFLAADKSDVDASLYQGLGNAEA
jgi:hypothetical protein